MAGGRKEEPAERLRQSLAREKEKTAALEKSLAEAREQKAAVVGILEVLRRSPGDVQPVFDAIVRRALRLVGGHSAAVTQVADGKLHLVALTATSRAADTRLRKAYPAAISRTSPNGRALHSRRPAIVRDTEKLPGTLRAWKETARARGFRSVVVVPMLRGGAAIGTLGVSRKAPGSFSRSQIDSLQAFASQAVIAIENARLFNETKEALERQTATAEILKVISSSPGDITPVFQTILDTAIRLCGGSTAVLWRYEDGLLRLAAGKNTSDEGEAYLRNHSLELGTYNPTPQAGLERRVIHVLDVFAEPEYRPLIPRGATTALPTASTVLAVPLLREDDLLGVMTIWRFEKRQFSDSQIEMVKIFADQAVIAIENVRLFNETKEALERQTATSEILKVIASSPSEVQPVFDSIVRSAIRLLNGVSGGVCISEGTQAEMVSAALAEGEDRTHRFRSDYPAALDYQAPAVQAIRENRVMHVPELAEGDFAPAVLQRARDHYRSALAVPMRRGDKSIGSISVTRREPGLFPAHHVELLQTFADQAVIAIENVRLFNETKEALERQTATAEILKVISSSPADVQPVFDAILEQALRLCKASFGYAYTSDGNAFDLTAQRGLEGDLLQTVTAAYRETRVAAPSTALGRVRSTRRPVHIADAREEEAYKSKDPRRVATVEKAGARTMLAVPLLKSDAVIGAVIIYRREVRLFDAKQITLLQTFADQAVIAIENVRLFNETKEALERQTATAEILKVIAGSPSDVQPVFDAIAQSAQRLLAGNSAHVVRRSDDVLQLVAHTATTKAGDEALRQLFPAKLVGQGAMGKAILTGAPTWVTDFEVDAAYTESFRKGARERGQRSMLAVPMLREGISIGGMAVARAEAGPFSDHQIDLLKTFADQAVIAIENVRLFNETKEALERQTATAEILKVIGSSPTDTQPVFEAIVQSGLKLFPGATVGVSRPKGNQVEMAAIAHHDPAVAEATRQRFPIPLTRDYLHSTAILDARLVDLRDAEQELDGPFGPGVRNFLATGNRAMTVMPMLRGGKAIGAISVTRPVAGALSEKQVALLRVFADQAVIAIENVRLFNETKEALEQQQASGEILRIVSQSVADSQPVFDAILAAVRRLFPGFDATVWRVERDQLLAVARGGPTISSTVGHSVPITPEYAHGVAVLERRVICLDDIASSSAISEASRQDLLSRNRRALLLVPLLREGECLGAISVSRTEPYRFADKQLAVLKTFADQAVIAIENTRLFNETKEALEHQKASADILGIISRSPTDISPVMTALAASAANLCEAADAHVWQREGDELVAVASHGALQLSRTRLRIGRDSVTGRAALQCVAVHVLDLAAEWQKEFPDSKQMAAGGYRTILAVPLAREGASIGAILIRRTEVRPFTARQLELLQTFADQAVIAIENVRLFNETKEALERQTATAEILKVISASPTDVQPVFEAIVESAIRLLQGATAHVTRLEEGVLHLVAYSKTDAAGAAALNQLYPLAVAGTAVAEVLERQSPLIVGDAETDSRVSDEVRAAARARRVRSFILVPLVSKGISVGTLVVNRRHAGNFSAHEIELLRTFADQAVIAIENVRLFNETKEALERQTATSEILRVISSSPNDLQPVFDSILENALRLCDAHMGVFSLYDGKLWRTAAQRGANPGFAEWLENRPPFEPPPDTVIGRMISGRQPVSEADLKDSAGYRRRLPLSLNAVDVGGLRSIAGVPMLKDGRVIGGIIIYRREVRPFAQKQIELVSTFANQAVIAIENVRLFRELESRTEALSRSVQQLTALGEVGHAISSTLDLDIVLKTIVARAVQITGLDFGTIYEFDEAGKQFELRAWQNMPQELIDLYRSMPIRLGEGIVGRAAVTGEPVQVPDIQHSGYQTRYREILLREGYRAVLAVPLLREGRIIGAITVSRTKPGEFPAEVIDLLKTFATQSALAIQNARLFREIAEKSRQLEEASKHKSQFLASMSHELRTPLNAILGFNEMLLGEVYGPVSEDMQPPLAQMQTSGKHLLRLINNVLDLAKIEAGRMELALSDYSVHDTVESVRATLRPLAEAKGLDFVVEMPPDLPLAHGDPGRITQCLMNLAGNSLKFTKAGKVEIRVDHKDRVLVYRVADTGIGIPADKIDSLFTEFKQTDATIASEFGGTGLGLSISKKFIEMHGGRIWAESAPGQGSTFIFEIPLRAGEENTA